MSFSRYEVYKDSGVEWIGDVPRYWTVAKFRHLFRESLEKIEGDVVGPMLSVSGYRGIEVKEYDDENRRRLEEDLQGYRIVRVGQLVVNTMWLNYAGLGVSAVEGHVSPAYRSYEINKELEKRFIHHLMRSAVYVQGYTRLLTGIRPNSLQMSRDDLMEFPILRPPSREQSIIANFLDRETSKIDALVDEQGQLIDLLKEKRQAVISHAITKGVDPDATVKPSGIDWLGDVPEHWSVVSLKRILEVKDGTHATPQYVEPAEDTFPLVTSKDFGETAICFDETKHISADDHLEVVKRSNTERGDVLMSMIGGNIGKAVIVETERVFSIKNVALFKTRKSECLAEYLLYYLQSGLLDIQIDLISRGGAQSFLGLGDIRNLIFLKMPPAEMELIVQYLERRLMPFNSLIKAAEECLSLMQERRSVLISAAVTGKIDVRRLASRAEAA